MASKDQLVDGSSQQVIRYGDKIGLYDDESRGYVFCHLSSLPHARFAISHSEEGIESVPLTGLPNVHAAVFEILAAEKCKHRKSLLKKLSESKSDASLKEDQQFTQELLEIEQKAKLEEEDNQREQLRQQGKDLLYGQIIQLRHQFTSKFFAVSIRATSTLEPSNLQCELSEHSSKKSCFRILPRYKVRSLGDKVRVGDQIQLESMKAERQYLHRSEIQLGNFVYGFRYEVNLSSSQSAFIAVLHSSFKKPQPGSGSAKTGRPLRGGSIIRLYHRELEAYIAAEGSFIDSELEKEEAENDWEGPAVHLRVRPQRQERPRSLWPTTSAIAYWQIELEETPFSGEQIKWGQRVRLRHMPTRRYLVCDYDFDDSNQSQPVKVKLRLESLNEKNVAASAFSFREVLPDEELNEGSVCRISIDCSWLTGGRKTVLWMCGKAHELFKKPKRPPLRHSAGTGEGLFSNLNWDKAELKKLEMSDVMFYDDAFSIQVVTEKDVRNFNYIAGMVPLLSECYDAAEKEKIQVGDALVDQHTKAAGYLIEAMLDEFGDPCKDFQKLLRNLRVIDQMVMFLCYVNAAKASNRDTQSLCLVNDVYKVLETFLVGDSRKNEFYMAKYFSSVFQHELVTDASMGLLTELMTENRGIIDHITETFMDAILTSWASRREGAESPNQLSELHQYFDLLCTLCICDGIAMRHNQNWITQALFGTYRTLLITTDLDDVHEDISWLMMMQGKEKSMCLSTLETFPEFVTYLEKQLNLFHKLCWGFNEFAIEKVAKDITLKKALSCLQNGHLDEKLRGKYCILLTTLFVDAGSSLINALDSLSLPFVYVQPKSVSVTVKWLDGSDSHGLRKECPVPTRADFHEICSWVIMFLKKKQRLTAKETEQNKLMVQVLELTYYLVKFGHFGELDMPHCLLKDLLRPLILLLDGRSDRLEYKQQRRSAMPNFEDFRAIRESQVKVVRKRATCVELEEEYERIGRFKESTENKIIAEVKLRGMKVLDLLMNYRMQAWMKLFVEQYKELRKVGSNKQSEGRNASLGTTGRATGQSQQSPLTSLIGAAMQMDVFGARRGIEAFARAEFTLHHSHNKEERRQILEMARAELQGWARQTELQFGFSEAEKLSRSHALKEMMGRRPSPLHGIPDEVVDMLFDLSHYEYPLVKVQAMHLLTRLFSVHADAFQDATQAQVLIEPESLHLFYTVKEFLPHLRRLMMIKMTKGERLQFGKIIDHLTRECWLEPDQTGGFQLSNEPHQIKQMILYNFGILDHVLELLGMHVTLAQTSQVISSEMTPIFAKCFKFLTAMARSNKVVQERLYKNMDMLVKVKGAVSELALCLAEVFTGQQELCLKVKDYQVKKLVQLLCENKDSAREICEALMAIVKVEDCNLWVRRNQASIITYLFLYRRKLVSNGVALGKHSPEVVTERSSLLLNGKSDDPRLQLLLGITNLMATCTEGEYSLLQSMCRKVFAYKEIISIITNTGILDQQKEPFVRFLVEVYIRTDAGTRKSEMATDWLSSKAILEHVVGVLEQVKLSQLHTRQAWIRESMFVTRLLRTSSLSASEEDAHQMLLRKSVASLSLTNMVKSGPSIVYLFNAILPLITAFFKDIYPRLRSSPDVDDTQLRRLAEAIMEELQSVCSEAHPANKMQLTKLIEALRTVCVAIRDTSELQNLVDKLEKRGYFTSWRVREYRKKFKAERELNKKFNDFVALCRKAYEGINSVSDQLGVGDDDAPYCEVGEDEDLPLGKEFQLFVQQFFESHISVVKAKSEGKTKTDRTGTDSDDEDEGPRFVKHSARMDSYISSDILDGLNRISTLKVDRQLEKLLDVLQITVSHSEFLQRASEVEKNNLETLMMKCLQVLRALIHNQIVLLPSSAISQQDKMKRKEILQLVEGLQQRMIDHDATKKLVPLLSHPSDHIVQETLALMAVLLYGPNNKVQASFETYFKETRDDSFVRAVQLRIQQSKKELHERRLLEMKQDRQAKQEEVFGHSGSPSPSNISDGRELVEKADRAAEKKSMVMLEAIGGDDYIHGPDDVFGITEEAVGRSSRASQVLLLKNEVAISIENQAASEPSAADACDDESPKFQFKHLSLPGDLAMSKATGEASLREMSDDESQTKFQFKRSSLSRSWAMKSAPYSTSGASSDNVAGKRRVRHKSSQTRKTTPKPEMEASTVQNQHACGAIRESRTSSQSDSLSVVVNVELPRGEVYQQAVTAQDGERIHRPKPGKQLLKAPHVVEEEEETEETWQDDSYIELVMRVMAMLCDGHQVNLQNYFYWQPHNPFKINLISETAEYLKMFHGNIDINKQNIALVTQIIQTLIEFTSGNANTVRALFDDKIIPLLDRFLRKESLVNLKSPLLYTLFSMNSKPEKKAAEANAVMENISKVLTLYETVVNLLTVMVELTSRSATGYKLAEEVGDNLNFAEFFDLMTWLPNYTNFLRVVSQWMNTNQPIDCKEAPKKKDFQALGVHAIQVGFKMYHLWRQLEDIRPQSREWAHSCTADQRKTAKKLYGPTTRSIELVHDDTLKRVYFRRKKQWLLPESTKEKLKWAVKRDSLANKHRDLLKWWKSISDYIDYKASLLRSHEITATFVEKSVSLRWLLLFLTFFLNIFMLLTWEAPMNAFEIFPDVPGYYSIVENIFGTLHLAVCCGVSGAYFVANKPYLVWPKFVYRWCGRQELRNNLRWLAYKIKTSRIGTIVTQKQVTYVPHDKDMESEPELRKGVVPDELPNQIKWFSLASFYHVLIIVWSVLGLLSGGYFYCFHLLHIVVDNDILLRVLQSITRNWKALAWVAALGFIIIYIYSMAIFAFLRMDLDRTGGLHCENLGQCFTLLIRSGLLSTLGEAIPLKGYSFSADLYRTFLDLSFFILITTIGLNIIFGIIVDAFTELRDKKVDDENDMKNVCFICGIHTQEFQKLGKDFLAHVHNEHNMWDYLYYFNHLKEIAKNDYTATEDFVQSKLAKNDFSFFPQNMALSLEDREEDETEFKALLTMVKGLEKQMKREIGVLRHEVRQMADIKTDDAKAFTAAQALAESPAGTLTRQPSSKSHSLRYPPRAVSFTNSGVESAEMAFLHSAAESGVDGDDDALLDDVCVIDIVTAG